ncbi:unnamed protein product [Rotaria sp. Silwood1]|nr:unnamed protein product [Rotaria sp. Silwood1]CAF4632623.1 unnamed protein product [Rotaria sp. Silwood1]CAF4746750.1 unnamed protein product [Rotaria sp. Silwood1]CAF4902727.1 unnamed protein product [Rotaria sp. Silwood1]
MDSGPFIDIIPIILNYLDLKSLVHLAKTCYFWKERIYTDVKLWPKVIELPYIGCMNNDVGIHNVLEDVIEAKLWSMVQPPKDSKALEKVLEKMASSEQSIQRFKLTKKVLFKNFIHTDESLRLTALLFPSIEEISFEGNLLSIVGVRFIALSCRKLKHIEFYLCDNLDIGNACRLFNTEDHRENLERIFIYNDFWSSYTTNFSTKDDLPFMDLCQRCGLYYNQLKNEKEMLCLYHPGKYEGYGHSCSSYDCCNSNTPNYPSTLGCQYTYHEKSSNTLSFNRKHLYELHDGHPEYMFQRYEDVKFPLRFTERRRLDECYEEWKKQELQQEE